MNERGGPRASRRHQRARAATACRARARISFITITAIIENVQRLSERPTLAYVPRHGRW